MTAVLRFSTIIRRNLHISTKMAIPREDIEFKTCDGTVLRGWLYPQAGKSPCVIMTHGVRETKCLLLY
jgi:hypothetical protein